MSRHRKPRALDWFALASVGLHKTKVAILEHLAEQGQVEGLSTATGVSPGELAVDPRVVVTLVDGSTSHLGGVSYHVRELREKGLVVLVRTEPKRGALQHFYVLTSLAVLSPAQAARRALERSATKLAGEPEPVTGETLARAFQTILCGQGESSMPWHDLPDDHRMRLSRAFGELLAGVAGA